MSQKLQTIDPLGKLFMTRSGFRVAWGVSAKPPCQVASSRSLEAETAQAALTNQRGLRVRSSVVVFRRLSYCVSPVGLNR